MMSWTNKILRSLFMCIIRLAAGVLFSKSMRFAGEGPKSGFPIHYQ